MKEKIDEMIEDTVMDILVLMNNLIEALDRLERYYVHGLTIDGTDYRDFKKMLVEMQRDLIKQIREKEKPYIVWGE